MGEWRGGNGGKRRRGEGGEIGKLERRCRCLGGRK